MEKLPAIVPRWLPALLMMVAIFAFSSRADNQLPDFKALDHIVKKSAHAIVYGLLALSYLRMLPKESYRLAWLLAVLYAVTDEFHQSFVPGRRASVVDVLVFDNLGAIIALFVHYRFCHPACTGVRRAKGDTQEKS